MATYSLNAVVIVFCGIPVTGFGKDDAITITPVGDTFEFEEGVDGEVIRVYTGSKLSDIKITLLQSSPSNDALSALFNADVLSSDLGQGGAGEGTFLMNDLNGTTIISAESASVVKPPEVGRSNKSKDNVWMLKGVKTRWSVGGQLP